LPRWRKTERKPPARSAAEAALALLARREHSRRELDRKLGERGYPADEIKVALDAASANGYLSDERAAAARLRAGLSRGHGPLKIRATLASAGLAPPEAEDEGEAIDWIARARAVAEKRFGAEPPASREEWARRARFLAQRGFPEAVIRKALAG
jgi:regulatory protein